MFTGLVQHLGRVGAMEATDTGRLLEIDAAAWSHTPAHGESVAINGCCLTVIDAKPDRARLRFDVIHQTLRVTTLGDLKVGDPVNVEASVTPTTLLGGHIVQGHVDGVAEVIAIEQGDGEYVMRIQPPAALMSCIIEKGSVALDGVSLTVASVDGSTFEVALIPTTLELTTLGTRAAGDRLNIEVDYLAKIVARQVAATLADKP